MVIVKLNGGLGNQLFQYAAARRLSVYHHTMLKLDISFFEYHKLRKYSLKSFRIQEVFATPGETSRIGGFSKKGLARIAFRLSQKLKPYYRRSNFSEPHIRPFDPNILKTPCDVYLDGYWQSEKYFRDIEDIIRHEFIVRYGQDAQSREIARKITGTQSVSIHVRRGDYVSNPETQRVHGACSLDYYRQSVCLIAQKVTNPHFFIFSDEPHWVTDNLHLDYPTTFVTHNDVTKDYEDLRLMSMCKHNIIANSSFSWWGAWLNPNLDKIILAPKKWFEVPDPNTDDLIPARWIRI